MSNRFTNLEPIASALCHLTSNEDVTIKSLAAAAEVHVDTIRNWCSGRVESIDADAIKRIISRHPSQVVRLTLANAMVQGSEFSVHAGEATNTDLDRDGVTTAKDVVIGMADMLESASAQMRELVSEMGRGNGGAEIHERFEAGFNALIQQATTARAAYRKAAGNGRLRMVG